MFCSALHRHGCITVFFEPLDRRRTSCQNSRALALEREPYVAGSVQTELMEVCQRQVPMIDRHTGSLRALD